MKVLGIILSAVLLFCATNITFSQPISKQTSSLDDLAYKISPSLIKMMKENKKEFTVSVSLKPTSFWPSKPNHVSYDPSELSTEQIRKILYQENFIIKRKIHAVADFITKNDGIVLKQTQSHRTGFISANVTSLLIPKLAMRDDVQYVGEIPYSSVIKTIRNDALDEKIIPKDTLVPTKVAGTMYQFSCAKIGGKLVKENSTDQSFCNYNGDYYRINSSEGLICTQAFMTIMDLKTGKQFTFSTGCGMPNAKDGSWRKIP